jgi:hypothetical protein
MKIILNRDVAIGGRHHAVGETVYVSDTDALALINMGKGSQILRRRLATTEVLD